jgi:hypothetical protein
MPSLVNIKQRRGAGPGVVDSSINGSAGRGVSQVAPLGPTAVASGNPTKPIYRNGGTTAKPSAGKPLLLVVVAVIVGAMILD